ncbi:MAG: hypothetical protein ACE5JR_13935, partial [Gemmatimonadota bacterium]
MVRVAVAETQRAAGLEAVALYLLDPSRQVLVLQEFAGSMPAFQERVATLPLSEARLAGRVIEAERIATIAVDDHPA